MSASVSPMSDRDKELSLVQHLGEFRNRLMVASIAVVITTAISFVFTEQIIRLLLMPAGLGPDGEIRKLASFSPTENFATYMRVALFSGFRVAWPVLPYQSTAHPAPPLHRTQRPAAPPPGPFPPLLFGGGLPFSSSRVRPTALDSPPVFGGNVFKNHWRRAD